MCAVGTWLVARLSKRVLHTTRASAAVDDATFKERRGLWGWPKLTKFGSWSRRGGACRSGPSPAVEPRCYRSSRPGLEQRFGMSWPPMGRRSLRMLHTKASSFASKLSAVLSCVYRVLSGWRP